MVLARGVGKVNSMNIRNTINIMFFCFVIAALSGCDLEESRPPYEPLGNIVSSGTKTMQWSEEAGLLNVDELESELAADEKRVFSQSLQWLGTESNIPFSALSDKTAGQIVDIANCLKSSASESYKLCEGKY